LPVQPGENERLLREAGFLEIEVQDTTATASLISKRWRDGRTKRAEALRAIEGQENSEGLQRFLSTVHALTSEARLLRLLYLVRKCAPAWRRPMAKIALRRRFCWMERPSS